MLLVVRKVEIQYDDRFCYDIKKNIVTPAFWIHARRRVNLNVRDGWWTDLGLLLHSRCVRSDNDDIWIRVDAVAAVRRGRSR